MSNNSPSPGSSWGAKAAAGLPLVCSVLTIIVGVPSTLLSCAQLKQVREEAGKATTQLDEIRRIAAASEANLQATARLANAAEAQAGYAKDQAGSAAAGAAQAERLAEQARLYGASAGRSATAAEQMAQASVEQVKFSQKLADQVQRPRLAVTDFNLTKSPGQTPPEADLTLENLGPVPAQNVRLWTDALYLTDGVPQQRLCTDKVAVFDSVPTGTKKIHLKYYRITLENVKQFAAGTQYLYSIGTVCYEDGMGRTYQTTYCWRTKPGEPYRSCYGGGNSAN